MPVKALNRILLIAVLFASTSLTCEASIGTPAVVQTTKYPKIVIYTAWYCDSCKAAGEYMTKNHIPFIKKDVDLNDDYMKELSSKYKINAVPVIVIGNNDRVLRGFNRDVFDQALKDVMVKTK
jgi:glutaredoxin